MNPVGPGVAGRSAEGRRRGFFLNSGIAKNTGFADSTACVGAQLSVQSAPKAGLGLQKQPFTKGGDRLFKV